jgi:hypothetical protein
MTTASRRQARPTCPKRAVAVSAISERASGDETVDVHLNQGLLDQSRAEFAAMSKKLYAATAEIQALGRRQSVATKAGSIPSLGGCRSVPHRMDGAPMLFPEDQGDDSIQPLALGPY